MDDGGSGEKWRQRVKGRDGERQRLGWVIPAGLKAELLKFGLIPPNLLFCPCVPLSVRVVFVCVLGVNTDTKRNGTAVSLNLNYCVQIYQILFFFSYSANTLS